MTELCTEEDNKKKTVKLSTSGLFATFKTEKELRKHSSGIDGIIPRCRHNCSSVDMARNYQLGTDFHLYIQILGI